MARVMGVYMDSITEYIYTIGEDKKFRTFDSSKNIVVSGKIIINNGTQNIVKR